MKGIAKAAFDVESKYKDVPVVATKVPCGAPGPE